MACTCHAAGMTCSEVEDAADDLHAEIARLTAALSASERALELSRRERDDLRSAWTRAESRAKAAEEESDRFEALCVEHERINGALAAAALAALQHKDAVLARRQSRMRRVMSYAERESFTECVKHYRSGPARFNRGGQVWSGKVRGGKS